MRLDINQDGEMELLIVEKLTGILSPEDQKLLNDWIMESESNKKLHDDFVEAWNAVQLLNEMRSYNSSAALKQVKNKLSRFDGRILLARLQQIAAVLFLPLLVALGFLVTYNGHDRKELNLTQTIKCPPGLSSSFELEDGTKVWLSSGAEIKFPVEFSANERRVDVVGEAFFDVVSDSLKPFFVDLNEVTVKVVGTQFNVENFDDAEYVQVSLHEGKVLLYTEQNGEAGDFLTDLAPGEQVRFNRETQKFVKTQIEKERIGNWINGELVFTDADIEEVIQTLEHWYNVEIIRSENETWSDFLLTATFEDESLTQILDILKYTSEIEYKFERDKNDTGQKVIRLSNRKKVNSK